MKIRHSADRAAALLGVAALGLALSGCAGHVGNGGDTPCGDYLELDSGDQKQVIEDFFSEKGNDDPSGGEVMLSQQSAKLYCNTLGSASDPIRNIDG